MIIGNENDMLNNYLDSLSEPTEEELEELDNALCNKNDEEYDESIIVR